MLNDYIFLMHNDASDGERDRGDEWAAYLAKLRDAGVFQGGSAIGDGVCVSKAGAAPGQADITEAFGDDERLGSEDWISTSPLNAETDDPESMGLPPVSADPDEVYRVAAKLSALRESIPIPNDGVYCPICHIANIDLKRLRTACSQCDPVASRDPVIPVILQSCLKLRSFRQDCRMAG